MGISCDSDRVTWVVRPCARQEAFEGCALDWIGMHSLVGHGFRCVYMGCRGREKNDRECAGWHIQHFSLDRVTEDSHHLGGICRSSWWPRAYVGSLSVFDRRGTFGPPMDMCLPSSLIRISMYVSYHQGQG